jgi:hypothetical protein
MKINELEVHRAISSQLGQHELIEKKLAIKIAEGSLEHHFPLSSKGEHIDFVFEDIAGNVYIAEVKWQTPPISAIQQLYGHEYKKFTKIRSDLDVKKIIPLLIIDKKSVTTEDAHILNNIMNIKYCTYERDEVIEILEKIKDEPKHIPYEFPDLDQVEKFLEKAKTIEKNFGDLDIILDGLRGEESWDGYYDFRLFWLWKDDKYPENDRKIFELLCKGHREDCIWFTFLNAIADSFEVAEYIVFNQNWAWNNVLSALGKNEEWKKFENCVTNSGKWCIVALLDPTKRKKVIKDYIKKVGNSQEAYFLKIMLKHNNPFDAYDGVYESIRSIKNIGNVVAAEFTTFLSQWRILPIIVSDNVRESKYVREALEKLKIKQPMESHRQAMLRLARKYSVAPVVIERSMHKFGRRIEKKESDNNIKKKGKK